MADLQHGSVTGEELILNVNRTGMGVFSLGAGRYRIFFFYIVQDLDGTGFFFFCRTGMGQE